jgi:regulator of cell morphogenesis and NO signaling
MFLPSVTIDENSLISDIVKQNHRTAGIFRKHGIAYCCGGGWRLETACLMKGLEFEKVKRELSKASHTLELPGELPFTTWSVDFLINYITNIHHHYLKTTLPETEVILKDFTEDHPVKYPNMLKVYELFVELKKDILPHLVMEEESVFPYIRQIANAYKNNDSFAKLLVKTLRKPIEIMSAHEHSFLNDSIQKFRELTNNYTPPEHACISHKISLAKLKELDNDLVQHIFLENEILFPRAIQIEKELLKSNL